MKKWLSGLLALVFAIALCAGCGGGTNNGGGTDDQEPDAAPPSGIYYDITGIDPRQTVMEVDGNAVPAEQYLYWVAYNCSNLDYQISMSNAYYGLYSEIFSEDGSLQWDAPADFLDGMNLSQYAKNQAEGAVRFYATLENLAKEQGVAITEEDEADMASQRAAAVEQLGSEEAFEASLTQMGITQETYERIGESNYLFNHLRDLVQEEGSDLYLDPADYGQYAVYADHILLATVDLASGEALSEEEIASKRETAEDLLSQLQEAEDVEALFTQLADEYSEDTGRAANPDGYIFGEGEMVQEFEDAAFALEPGQVSEIVESTYGYHIILRKDLTAKLETDPDQKAALAEQHLSGLLNHRAESAEITGSEVLDTLDAGNFYAEYRKFLEELNAANELETGSVEDSKLRVGDTVEKEGLKITWLECESNWTGYSEYLKPSDGMKIIRVNFSIENVGEEDLYCGSGYFSCYADDVKCEKYYCDSGAELSSGQVSAGRKIEGNVYFEVPVTANEIELEYDLAGVSGEKLYFVVE